MAAAKATVNAPVAKDQSASGKLADVGKTLVAGTAGGIAQVFAGHPFDTVKTKMQIDGQGGRPRVYQGMAHCFRTVMQQEGIAGLYKGALSPIAGAMAHNAWLFFTYAVSKNATASLVGRDANNLDPQHLFFAGAAAGVAISVVETPVDLFKIKMQGQDGKGGQYSGSWDCAKKVYRGWGVRGIYQGIGPTMIRNIPAFGGYFGGFEVVRRAVTTPGEKPSLLSSMIGGAAAGFCFWAPAYPLELIKSRMQQQPSDPSLRAYSSFMDCWAKTIRTEGYSGLYKGFVPCVTRAVPVNAAIFLAVSYAKSLLSDDGI